MKPASTKQANVNQRRNVGPLISPANARGAAQLTRSLSACNSGAIFPTRPAWRSHHPPLSLAVPIDTLPRHRISPHST